MNTSVICDHDYFVSSDILVCRYCSHYKDNPNWPPPVVPEPRYLQIGHYEEVAPGQFQLVGEKFDNVPLGESGGELGNGLSDIKPFLFDGMPVYVRVEDK